MDLLKIICVVFFCIYFDLGSVGLGMYIFIYEVMVNVCMNSDSIELMVIECLGIDEFEMDYVFFYLNLILNKFVIEFY